MSRLFYHVCQDNVGNLLFDVSGTMRIAGSGTLATIYGDEALTVILPNPMTNHPSFGSFKCFLAAGDYDFYLSKSGYTFETLTGVQGSGTMADQNANAVAITGGQIILPATTAGALRVSDVAGNGMTAFSGQVMAGGTDRYNIFCGGTAPNYFVGNVGIGIPPTSAKLALACSASTGLTTYPSAAGTAVPLYFLNASLVNVGNITTTDTTTAYNTTSDARLKHATTPLTGALDVIRALKPITHLWRADDSRGYGFVAHEVQDTLPADAGVVTGERDAVGPQGEIVPQQIDYGKLVPWLTAALRDALGALDTLTARVASLEQQLGV